MVDDNVKYQEVSSSNLHSVGYDPENQNLFIIFLDANTGGPGTKYAFYHVQQYVFDELLAAGSKGKYFAAYIKKNYSYDRLQSR